jgi:hypothetical protein
MAEEYTCIECERLYDNSDGSIEDQMCKICIDKIHAENLERVDKRVKSTMSKVDEFIDWVKGVYG